MASRYWRAGWSIGYAGTEETELIDLKELFGYSDDEIRAMSQDLAESKVSSYAWERVTELCEGWAEPITKKEFDEED